MGTAFADDNSSIPAEVLQKANSLVVTDSIPELEAWEVDLNGNKEEVTPLSQRIDQKISPSAVPNDGFIYAFDDYLPDFSKKNWTYQNMGTVRIENKLSTPAEANYTQTNTDVSSWNVGVNISGKAEVGVKFLAKLEITLGGSWGMSKTFTKSTSYGIKQQIPGKTTAYITAYAVGGNSNGSLAYKKYSPSGASLLGYYYESAGGTAVNKNDANIVISSTEPIK
ncbi:hypothetical protein D3C78_1124310 [compost metagenome]